MKEMVFVTFLWNTGFRHYRPEHVNLLAAAIRHFYRKPHRFVCVTDEMEGFSEHVEPLKTPDSAKRLLFIPAPQGSRFPSSYRRLWCLSEEAKQLGERIMLLDVDCAVLGDPSPLLRVRGDFVGWRPRSIWGQERRIGGGTWMHRTGTLTWVWDKFIQNPQKHIAETRLAGWNGSDQAILSRWLLGCKVWPRHCGIYGSQDGVYSWATPPKDAVIVHFNGHEKMWDSGQLWMRAYCKYFGGHYATETRQEHESSPGEHQGDDSCRETETSGGRSGHADGGQEAVSAV